MSKKDSKITKQMKAAALKMYEQPEAFADFSRKRRLGAEFRMRAINTYARMLRPQILNNEKLHLKRERKVVRRMKRTSKQMFQNPEAFAAFSKGDGQARAEFQMRAANTHARMKKIMGDIRCRRNKCLSVYF